MAKGYKTGGRQKGTPNKDNPLKGQIRSHSEDYFTPKEHIDFETGKTFIASQFDIDMVALSPSDRVNAELRLLKFHMAEMKAVEMDMTVSETSQSIEDRLKELMGEDEED